MRSRKCGSDLIANPKIVSFCLAENQKSIGLTARRLNRKTPQKYQRFCRRSFAISNYLKWQRKTSPYRRSESLLVPRRQRKDCIHLLYPASITSTARHISKHIKQKKAENPPNRRDRNNGIHGANINLVATCALQGNGDTQNIYRVRAGSQYTVKGPSFIGRSGTFSQWTSIQVDGV